MPSDQITETLKQSILMVKTYADISATQPELDELSKQYSVIRDHLSDPREDPIKTVEQWDTLRRKISTWQNLVELKFNQDTTNPKFIADREACDELSPQLTELDVSIKRILLDGPHRQRLQKEFGEQAFALWKSETLAFDPEIKLDLVEESRLAAEYNSLLSSAKLEFDGQVFNHEGIDQFKFDADRTRRYDSMQVKWKWFEENRERLDDIFAKLVLLRDSMAKTLGFDNYVGMGYQRMCRVDYNREDVAFYRNQVAQHVVPFCSSLMSDRATTLGIDKVMMWDESVHSTAGNPKPLGDHDWMIDRAKEMFDEMSPALGRFFRLMVQGELIDLKNRDTKGGGGFCTDFPEYGLPFIFANFNGSADDVRVFTHEMGHAFQGFCSRNQKIYDYVWPTYESCEIHSMGLEFMSFPHMKKFFGQAGDQFCHEHVIDSFMFFPYGVAVDHFQHLVYENPRATGDDRMDMWKEVEALYLPWRDCGDLPHVTVGGRWQLQRHIYMYPFYYIDYTLALACALQFWMKSQADFSGTLVDYEKLCVRGGEAPFRGLAESAGLESPFSEGVLQKCVSFAKDYLG